MLSISVPMKGAGKGEYYLRLAQEDYYFNQGEPLGQWYGQGAKRLGLAGRIDPVAMRRLLDGFSPDGRRALVQNPGDPDRQSGWDLTFSAPKSVSVLWALAPEPVRREIEAIHEAALKQALDYLQEKAAFTRRGKEGKQHERADFTFGTFRHSISRELDMLLHTHALLMNVCVRKDGTTGTVWSRAFFKLKKKAGSVYAEALARGVEQRFGLKVEAEKVGFHVLGVPRELCREFSKRRRQIEEYLAGRKESGAIAAKQATLKTRRKKTAVNRQELFTHWQQVAERFGWGKPQVEELLARARQEKTGHTTNSKQAEASAAAPPDAGPTGTNTTKTNPQEQSPSTPRPPEHGRPQEKAKSSASQGQREGMSNQDRRSEQERSNSEQTQSAAGAQKSDKSGKSGPDGEQRTKTKRRIRRRAKRTKGHGKPKSQFKDHRAWSRVLWEKDFVVLRLRVQHKRFFRKAPSWNPAHKWGLPAVRVLTPRPAPVWAKVLWQKNIIGIELRLQQKRLFAKAPSWSPVSQWKLPALRLAPESANLLPTKPKSKDHSQHH